MDELVTAKTSNIEFADIWQGEASLRFNAGLDADLAMLAPAAVERGYLFSYAETLEPGSRI
jgi:hypothetical protein